MNGSRLSGLTALSTESKPFYIDVTGCLPDAASNRLRLWMVDVITLNETSITPISALIRKLSFIVDKGSGQVNY